MRLGGDRVGAGLLALGAGQLALGAWQILSPGTFYDVVAGFGARNDHDLRDVATFYLALGVAMLVATRRRSWRVPVLALAAVQYGLHAVNHLVDVGDADPGWVGPADLVSLALVGAVLAWLLRAAWRAEAR